MEPNSGNWIAADDVNRLVRQIDVALNGADAAPQATLCDIAGQLATLSRTHGPLLPLLQKCLTPQQVVPVEAQGRLTGIDSPHFKVVAWFDTFNAHVYFSRDEAQRAHDGGNTVLPIESMSAQAPASVPDGFYLASFKLASFKRKDCSGAMLWWGPDNAGYTTDIEQAGIYTEITPGYHDSDHTVPVPVSFFDGCRIRRTLDPGDSKNRAFWSAADLRAAITANQEGTPREHTDR